MQVRVNQEVNATHPTKVKKDGSPMKLKAVIIEVFPETHEITVKFYDGVTDTIHILQLNSL